MADKASTDSWDLTAVVRSCSSAIDTITSTTNTTTHLHKFRTNTSTDVVETRSGTSPENPLSFLSSLKFEEEDDPFFFPNLVQEPNNGFEELHDSFKQFFNKNDNNSSSSPLLQKHQQQEYQHQQPSSLSVPITTTTTMTTTTTTTALPVAATSSTSSSLFVFGDPEIENQQSIQHPQPQQEVAHDLHPLRHTHQSRSSRKRKTPQKRMVCHVTAENLSSDLWAWRKYGQKPIKGSPYPRNYYRCSSSKGCAARKQVERSNTDPNIFIVSYTGDHTHPRPTHRNSLAGSSRNKFPRTQNPIADADAASPTPHPSAAMPVTLTPEVAPTEEEKTDAGDFYEQATGAGTADEEVDEDDLLIPNLSAAFNEDPFSGLDELHVNNPASSGGVSGG